MINEVSKWIEETVSQYIPHARKCSELAPDLRGCYSEEFLDNSYFVVTENIPKPQVLSQDLNLRNFITMDVDGITYKNLYFVKPQAVNDIALHVHELVHVYQWSILGVQGFLERYITEVTINGYQGAPLEQMAYEIEQMFRISTNSFDILSIVKQRI
ncbi:hypothetical protein VXS04_10050 [Photobacterium piscicola]|uniref:hypothetical protein n=1 Tax=Photobacterium piscicola TaxID=1378299 RepID=UPI002E194498|nr:hypothetical protein [Photobacterium piscicola]